MPKIIAAQQLNNNKINIYITTALIILNAIFSIVYLTE